MIWIILWIILSGLGIALYIVMEHKDFSYHSGRYIFSVCVEVLFISMVIFLGMGISVSFLKILIPRFFAHLLS